MRKCEHGNYIPNWVRGNESPYCTGCANHGRGIGNREVVLPRSSASLNVAGQANRHKPGACPECGEVAHVEISATVWECPDCGKRYKAPRHAVQAAQIEEMREAAGA